MNDDIVKEVNVSVPHVLNPISGFSIRTSLPLCSYVSGSFFTTEEETATKKWFKVQMSLSETAAGTIEVQNS